MLGRMCEGLESVACTDRIPLVLSVSTGVPCRCEAQDGRSSSHALPYLQK